MVTTKLGAHEVEYYDAIDELPVVRYHRFQKLLLIDAGIGSDIAAFDRRLESARRFLMAGKPEQVQQELENIRQCVHLIQSSVSPSHLAFAALVTRLDGKECTDLSDDALAAVTATLGDVKESDLATAVAEVKKKIDGELMLYFPSLFNGSELKEYYDLLRKRTLAVLKGIVDGVDDPLGLPETDKLTTQLVTYSNPRQFTGPEGVEVQFDRQFENLCLMLSEQLHVDPKRYTVMEFHNAFDFLKERMRLAEEARKRPARR